MGAGRVQRPDPLTLIGTARLPPARGSFMTLPGRRASQFSSQSDFRSVKSRAELPPGTGDRSASTPDARPGVLMLTSAELTRFDESP